MFSRVRFGTRIRLAPGRRRGYDRAMFWRLALACVLLAALLVSPLGASANGRPPTTSSITFRQGHESDIAVGLTFGLLMSHDSGKTWTWMCEDAVGYSGEYDPHYAFSPSGALFATTHDELKVVRDSCTFTAANTAIPTETFASIDALAGDHSVYYAAAEAPDESHGVAGDYKIYKSNADGTQFAPTAGQPAGLVSWWQSLSPAPSDARVLYLTGYVFTPNPAGGSTKEQRMFRSDDSGASWLRLPLDPAQVTVAPNSLIDVVGIAGDDPSHVYIRVTYDDNTTNHSLYRSIDSGVTWHRINRKPSKLDAFVVRAALHSGHHDLIVGGSTFDAEISHDDGETWTVLASPPHGRCLVENAAGELWACAENYGTNGVANDSAGIVKTLDPEAGPWTKVLRYQDLTEAASCPSGSKQAACSAMWCGVCAQLGCTPSAAYTCAAPMEAPLKAGGCCDGGAGGTGALAFALPLGMLLLRPRRRRGTHHAIHIRHARCP
jgi:photosystem II stability/assembly factor-like uncharacterized protein